MSNVSAMGEDAPEPFGRFMLVERLRKGGMGSAWIAVDTTDGRIVVVKRPNATAGDLARFQEEAQLTRALGKHPHLVEPVDSGTVEGAGEFLALEWIAGQDVEALTERAGRRGKPVPLPVASAVVRQVCAALDYAHGREAGFVHRDVKPANIVVSYDGVAKLIDYGGALSRFKTSKTEAGHVFGSVGFIAPELAKGAPPTERCDQYGAGAVLYFMLTGVPPFFDKGMDGNSKEVLRHRLAELKVPELPDALVTFLWRALQANPRNRYESAGEMAKVLELALPLATAADVGAFVSSIFPVEKKYAVQNAEQWRGRYAPKRPAEKTAVMRAAERPPVAGRSTMVIDRVPRTRAPLIAAVAVATAAVAGAVIWWLAHQGQPRNEGTQETRKEANAPAATPAIAVAPPPVEPSAPVEPAPVAPAPVKASPAAPSIRPPAAEMKRLQEARALIREGKTIKAADMLDELDRDSRMSGSVKAARAELAAQQGDYNGAIALASAAAKLGAGAHAFHVRADAEMHAGRFDQAERDYDRVLKLEPNNEDAREGKRLAHEKLTRGSE